LHKHIFSEEHQNSFTPFDADLFKAFSQYSSGENGRVEGLKFMKKTVCELLNQPFGQGDTYEAFHKIISSMSDKAK
jgi:hypothetical protein